MSCDLLCGHEDTVMCLDSTEDGEIIVSGSKDNTGLVWRRNINNSLRKASQLLGHTGAVTSVALTPKTGAFVLTASADRTVKMWKLKGLLLKLY